MLGTLGTLGTGYKLLGTSYWVVVGRVYWDRVLGTGYWVQGTGYRVLGTRYWVLGTGYWVLGAGCWVLGAGYWVLGTGCAQLFTKNKFLAIVKPNCSAKYHEYLSIRIKPNKLECYIKLC